MSKEKLAAIVQKDEGFRWISESIRESNGRHADVWREHEEVLKSQDRVATEQALTTPEKTTT